MEINIKNSISGEDIKFAIFDDRIEIIYPGLLLKTLDIEDIKMGGSEIRNKVIARFFKEIRFIEEWGTGISRIIKSCTEAGLQEPEFIETGMFFKVVIKKKSSDKIELNDSENKIIQYLKKNFIFIILCCKKNK